MHQTIQDSSILQYPLLKKNLQNNMYIYIFTVQQKQHHSEQAPRVFQHMQTQEAKTPHKCEVLRLRISL